MVKSPKVGVHGKSNKVYNIGIENNKEKCHKYGGESAHVSFDICDLLLCNSHLILRFLKSTEDCITLPPRLFISSCFSRPALVRSSRSRLSKSTELSSVSEKLF